MTLTAEPILAPPSTAASAVAAKLHARLLNESADRDRCERSLRNLPFPHRHIHDALRAHPSWMIAIEDLHSIPKAAFALEVHTSRALPGHLLLRAQRLSLLPAYLEPAAAFLVHLARCNQRVLRVNLELFSRDENAHAAMGRILGDHGFYPVPITRSYQQTLAIDLDCSEASLFASLHPTARRHIRALSRKPVQIKPISDPALADRLTDLSIQTMSRTRGSYLQPDWRTVIELSSAHPHLSRLVGLFRTDATGPESLLAFAWAQHHGDHAHYEAAASTRKTDLTLPLAYALAWDLILWSKQNGAAWFDFGGITSTSRSKGDTDSLSGISDFKRYFSQNIIKVAEEYQLDPHPIRATAARMIAGATRAVTLLTRSARLPST